MCGPKHRASRPEALTALETWTTHIWSDVSPQPTRRVTEITVVGGDRYRVQGDVRDVERKILDAARGSLMELSWLVEAETGENLAINPECVVMLRAVE
jgi:hypothetical protein